MVGGDDEERVAKPRLCACSLEELAQRHIRVANQGVIRYFITGKHFLIAFRKVERVVRTDGKFSSKEGLLESAEFVCEVLQKLFVPNAPPTIEIFRVVVFIHTEISIETHLSGEGIKAHRPILRIVKEGGVVP